jgi:hypothetical protein
MRRAISAAAVAGLVVVGLVSANYRAEKPAPEKTKVTLLFPKEDSPQELLWPTNNSKVWSIKPLGPAVKGKGLSLVARVVHKRLRKGESPAIGPRTISKAESNSELSFGKLLAIKPDDSAIVCMQMIDLQEVGVSPGKKPLRLLLHLMVGMTTASRTGERSGIEGGSFVGMAPNSNPIWKDGELHLQCLFVQTEDRLTTYDLVLVTR